MESTAELSELVLNTPANAAYHERLQQEISRRGIDRDMLVPFLGQAKDTIRQATLKDLIGERREAIRLLRESNEAASQALAARMLLDDGSRKPALEAARKGEDKAILCEALAANGETEAAQKLFSELRLAPTSAEWSYLTGAIEESRGEYRAALEHMVQAAERAPENARYQFRAAYLQALYGDEDLALTAYEAAARCQPLFAHALINLGVLYEDAERYEDAADCYLRVLSTYPNHARAQLYYEDTEASRDMYYDREKEKERSRRNQLLQLPVTDFELSVRSRNCLTKMNIHTLGDLITKSEAELLSYKNFGETSLAEIKRILTQKGLRLGSGQEETRRETKTLSDGEQSRVLTDPVSVLELSSRSQRCMDRLGIETLADLVKKSELDLISQKNFGVTSLNEVKKKLGERGLGLAPG